MPILTKFARLVILDKQAKRMVEVMDKLLRNINEQLWREVKSKAALDGLSMKDWVEKVLAEKLRREDLLTQKRDRRRKA